MKKTLILSFIASFAIAAPAQSSMTIEKWQALSTDDKELLIDGIGVEMYANLNQIAVSNREAMSLVRPPFAKSFAKSMEDFMQTHSNLEVEDEHSRIGAPYVYWINVVFIDKQVLGGSIGFIQDGCDMTKDNWQYFATELEAKAAGCDVEADVSWQAHAIFDWNGRPIDFDEYMEWSGY